MSDGTNEIQPASSDVNAQTKEKQTKIGIAVAIGAVIVVYALVSMTSPKKDKETNVKSESLTEVVQRRPGDKDSFDAISRQVNGLLGDVEKFEETTRRLNEFLDSQENEDVLGEIRSTVNGTESLVEDMERRLKKLETQSLSEGGRKTFGRSSDGASRSSNSKGGSGAIQARPSNADEVFAPRGRQDRVGTLPTPQPAASRIPSVRKQNVIELFKPAEGDSALSEKKAELVGYQTKAKKPEVYDTEHYLPPNAYVSARLVVSVDAPIGEVASSDPKAAQFIITGPARHVQDGNKIEQTDLEGCLVNGSSQGDLSSERVFINLHAMTCPMGEGRVSVSKVEGYATHLGKNGIRGTVVSREGDLVTKSMIAGTLEGLGRTAGQFGNGVGGVGGGAVFGERPDTKDIVTGSLGTGVASGAGVYSQYLLERARAYEPVVSLPTGIEVELVFISGTLVRPLGN